MQVLPGGSIRALAIMKRGFATTDENGIELL
jgi:hypothetical protein